MERKADFLRGSKTTGEYKGSMMGKRLDRTEERGLLVWLSEVESGIGGNRSSSRREIKKFLASRVS